jgi:hypothetical protein
MNTNNLLLITKTSIRNPLHFNEIKVLVDAAAHSKYEALIICDIRQKTVERSENEYLNSQLIINTYNTFVRLQVNKGSYQMKRFLLHMDY